MSMEKGCSFIIADDDTVYPFGLNMMLLKIDNKHKIKFAENGKQAIDIIEKEKVDVVFMDYNMPTMNGVEATEIISRDYPGTKVIAFSVFKDRKIISEMINAGVKGYILKEAKREEIEMAIKMVMEGKHFYSEEIYETIWQMANEKRNKSNSSIGNNRLSEAEKEVALEISLGFSNKQIAKIRFTDVRTVEKHRQNIKIKKGLETVNDYILYAKSEGWINSLDFFITPQKYVESFRKNTNIKTVKTRI